MNPAEIKHWNRLRTKPKYQKLIDAKIYVEDRVINAHKIVLMKSKYFKHLIFIDDSPVFELEIPHVSYKIADIVIDELYGKITKHDEVTQIGIISFKHMINLSITDNLRTLKVSPENYSHLVDVFSTLDLVDQPQLVSFLRETLPCWYNFARFEAAYPYLHKLIHKAVYPKVVDTEIVLDHNIPLIIFKNKKGNVIIKHYTTLRQPSIHIYDDCRALISSREPYAIDTLAVLNFHAGKHHDVLFRKNQMARFENILFYAKDMQIYTYDIIKMTLINNYTIVISPVSKLGFIEKGGKSYATISTSGYNYHWDYVANMMHKID